MRITYYLFKKSVRCFDDTWKPGLDREQAGYRHLELKSGLELEAQAYLQANKPSTPQWWPFVRPYISVPDKLDVLSHSSSFLLLLNVAGRFFAVTFGHAFTAINRARLEADFGLKVALNSVNPKKLRSLQARNVDPTTVQKQLVVNQDSALSVFDVDFYHDLLAKLEGVPEDSSIGERVSGADACYLLAEVEFPKLADKCAQLLKQYGKKSYQEHFEFVDQIKPERDETTIAALDDKLTDAMKAGDTSALGFTLPDIGAYDRVHHYRLHKGKWNATFTDLSAEAMLNAYNADHTGQNGHLDLSIRAMEDDDRPLAEFTVRDCAVFQVKHSRHTYVLTLGQWYQVSDSYAKRVEDALENVKPITRRGYLPAIPAGQSEGEYNEACGKSGPCHCVDKKTVKPTGATSKVEVCDLFSPDAEFIHVKRHTRSATLSHLLAQGSVSAQLFADDKGYRTSFRKMLPPAMRSLVDPNKIEHGKYSVVYAISAPPARALPEQLPFFTKVNLLFHSQAVTRMGMKPRLFHIHEA